MLGRRTRWGGLWLSDGSRLCCPQSDCDDGGGADLPGVGRRAWGERVVEREAATKIGE
jgi:hypothetical protein